MYKSRHKEKSFQQLEIDFVARKVNKQIYIQSALNVDLEEKMQQEINSFLQVKDFFEKVVIVKSLIKPRNDQDGIIFISIFDFLLNENIFE